MRLNKKLQFAVSFANFSAEHKITPPDLGQLIALATAAANAYVNANNSHGTSAKYDAYTAKVEALVTSYGFECRWDGLKPTLVKDGHDHWLPIAE